MKAVWPTLVRQKYGRVIFVASPAIYGAGVAAYSSSKAGLIGLANSLQFEANKRKLAELKVNTIIPWADTRMTRDFATDVDRQRKKQGKKPARSAPATLLATMSPDKVAAMVGWLAHRSCPTRATIHEAGAGFFAQVRLQRSAPLFATAREGVTDAPWPEHIRDGVGTLTDFDRGEVPPTGDGSMGGVNPVERVLSRL